MIIVIAGKKMGNAEVSGKMGKDNIQLFEDQKIRTAWDEEKEEWYFSVVDVVAVLTESKDPAAYWRKLKQRLKEEGNETVTNCHGLKMTAAEHSVSAGSPGYCLSSAHRPAHPQARHPRPEALRRLF